MDGKIRTINLRCTNLHEVVLIEKLAARMGVSISEAVERVCADEVRDTLLLTARETSASKKKETHRHAV